MRAFRFAPALPRISAWSVADGMILLGLAGFLFAALRLALHAPPVIRGPEISLAPSALPWYTFLSCGRMVVAFILSLIFSLAYGHAAARHRLAGIVLLPLLDVLQSIPILSFLPVALLGLSAILPQGLAAELAAILLIVTSQAWNMTFCFYQALITIPGELGEAATVFRFNSWQRFKSLELPFAALGLVWNSMMSWAGGWFFLMAAETFRVGARDFRLPGLGAYLQVAAGRGDVKAVLAGLATLVMVIVLLDQIVWRPLLAWADKFKLEMTAGEEAPASWAHDLLSRSVILERFETRLWAPLQERLDAIMGRRTGRASARLRPRRPVMAVAVLGGLGLLAGWGAYRAATVLALLPRAAWGTIGLALLATAGRVAVSLLLALIWTIPLGVAIGSSPRLAARLQPIVQVIAAIPATALFPVLLLALVRIRGGIDIAAILLMLMGTQWYLLFNVIAGAASIPQDLRNTTALLRLTWRDRWTTLVLPALFPYLVTGAITASGGAWNASIVAEHAEFAGRSYATRGVGALIAEATERADYPLLLAATLALVALVVGINRTLWRSLYHRARTRYQME